jgi:hypothetical protein
MPSTIIKPSRPVFDAKKQERIIQNTLTAQAKGIKVDFDVTTQTWKHRPTFAIATSATYERTVSTDDEVYGMLNKGTKKHDIKPKRTRFLVFNTPFRSKTLPNKIMSRAGSVGETVARARVVHHPGTAARNWARTIAKKWQAQIGPIFQRALDSEV